MTFLAGQRVTAEALNIALEKIIARGRRVTNGGSNGVGTETGVLRIDDIPVRAGYAYRVSTSNLNIDTNTADDEIHVRIRYTTDGSTPTITSAVLGTVRITADDATFTPILPIVCFYFPAVDETLSLLLTCQRVNGAGTTSVFANGTTEYTDMILTNLGVDTGDIGTDI